MLINIRDVYPFRVISTFVIFSLLLYSSPAIADEAVVTLQEGDVAPFSGTLFNTEAAAQMLVQLENSQAACQIEIDRVRGETEATLQYKVDIERTRADACMSELDLAISLRDDHIGFLVDQRDRTIKRTDVFWLTTGLLSGVALSMGTAWAWGQVSSEK